jgi:hypothetical protein
MSGWEWDHGCGSDIKCSKPFPSMVPTHSFAFMASRFGTNAGGPGSKASSARIPSWICRDVTPLQEAASSSTNRCRCLSLQSLGGSDGGRSGERGKAPPQKWSDLSPFGVGPLQLKLRWAPADLLAPEPRTAWPCLYAFGVLQPSAPLRKRTCGHTASCASRRGSAGASSRVEMITRNHDFEGIRGCRYGKSGEGGMHGTRV